MCMTLMSQSHVTSLRGVLEFLLCNIKEIQRLLEQTCYILDFEEWNLLWFLLPAQAKANWAERLPSVCWDTGFPGAAHADELAWLPEVGEVKILLYGDTTPS